MTDSPGAVDQRQFDKDMEYLEALDVVEKAETTLPCPFCGGEASVGKMFTFYDNTRGVFWEVACLTFLCMARQMGRTKRIAISEWNKRV